ncbi:hypothetical protein PR202_ga00407 [Eleusine coracana subsp. coracana]|uniref:Shugoshin C-terminal domain-containing protein n=1 Tax=Eleusine coracana subsp. coracana TaxID=191504 RepID=A0AAV5BEH1_ELECO|nr:hypothetical protein PR202_ga00407 [Eleusine coracana subsp. coracana]
MEAAVLVPQQAVPSPEPALAKTTVAAPGSLLKPRCASAGGGGRRKTLCDITNLSRRVAAEDPDEPACADGGIAQLENADLLKLLEERNQIIELSGAEIQKLRLANWELARANSQMSLLKILQHELVCSRAALKAKTSELEDAKKMLKRRIVRPQEKTANQTGQHLGSDRAAQTKDGDVVDPEPASDATRTGSIQRPGNASRKRMLRSRSLGPGSATKLALPKETTQRRKSMRIPQPSDRREDLFELEDVQLAIGGCKIDPECTSDNERPGQTPAQFLRRSSLGRPLRQARERVATYKEVPLNIKLRRS